MHPGTPGAKPRALLVHDDPVVSLLLRHGLESGGVEVIAAADGASGWRDLLDHLLDLDLLITDLKMPGPDGSPLIRLVREGGEHDLSILVVAAAITPQDRASLSRLAVTAFVEMSAGSHSIVRRAIELAEEGRARRPSLGPDAAYATVPLAPVRLQRIRRP